MGGYVRVSRKTFVSAVLAGALLITPTQAALASTTAAGSVPSAAAAVAAAGKAHGKGNGDAHYAVKTTVGPVAVAIPRSAGDPVTVGEVKIGLPNLGGQDAAVTEDGTVTYSSTTASADMAAQATLEGARALGPVAKVDLDCEMIMVWGVGI
jgi:hypothetical protein